MVSSMQAVRGESMPQDRMTRRMKFAKVAKVTVGAAVVALAVCANMSAVRAGDDLKDDESLTDKFMRTLGLKNPGATEAEINSSEPSPLVVPPSRNLPPPVSSAVPAANWPK